MQTPDTIMRAQPNYGGMTVYFNKLPKGTDFTPLLQGLSNDSCHCPHWGYVLEGEMLIKYDDGTEELLQKNDVFYLPPGHTASVQKDIKFINFSPQQEFKDVVDHIEKKVVAMQNQ